MVSCSMEKRNQQASGGVRAIVKTESKPGLGVLLGVYVGVGSEGG